jgi:hypothetical protein
MSYLKAQLPRVKSLLPYAAAMMLPGGSLIAVGMWLYSRYRGDKPSL